MTAPPSEGEAAPAIPAGGDGPGDARDRDAGGWPAGRLPTWLGAFGFGLDLGWASTFALLGMTAWQVLRGGRAPGTARAGLAPGAVLATALGAYYAITVAHGQYDAGRAAAYLAICLLAYAAGLTAAGERDGDLLPLALQAFVFAALGSSIYALLSAGQGLEIGDQLAVRSAPSAWDPSMLAAATALGAEATPGLALLGAAAFSVREAGGRAWRAAMLLAAGAGLLANALLLNRSPFVALLASLAACGWLFLRAGELAPWARRWRLLALSAGAAAALAWALTLLGDGDATILARFEGEGLSTARYEVWWEVLSQLFSHPLGGRAFPISENFAHNLWLDAGYDAGPVPFLLLLAFHALHVPAVLAVVRRHPSLNARLVTASALVAFGLTSMAEPGLAMSVPHVATGLFVLGGLRRAASALEEAWPPPEAGTGPAEADGASAG